MNIKTISQKDLVKLLKSYDFTFALIDVRERPEYNKEQILFATNIAKGLLEFKIQQLVPVNKTKIILYDNDEVRATWSADLLGKLGYTNVFILEGGLNNWTEHTEYLINGLNVPSKAFGEIVFTEKEVPYIKAETLKERKETNKNDFIVIDVRPKDEVQEFKSVPGAINISGVELLNKANYFRNEEKDLIITCAGRTRGIIATQTLKEMGFENVYNLKDGTMGWLLAGFKLKDDTIFSDNLKSFQTPDSKQEEYIENLTKEHNIKSISLSEYQELRNNRLDQVLYEFDVRTPLEFEQGHIPNTISLPGGQAIQTADDHIAVRDGVIIFISNNVYRSTLTAYWFKSMGFKNIFVLEGGLNKWQDSNLSIEQEIAESVPLGYETAKSKVDLISAPKLKCLLDDNEELVLVDIGLSRDYQTGHISNSVWISRSWLEFYIHKMAKITDRIILVDHDGYGAILSSNMLNEMGFENVFALKGGKKSWLNEGFSLDKESNNFIKTPDDIAHEPEEIGGKAMTDYLEWELTLEEKLEFMKDMWVI